MTTSALGEVAFPGAVLRSMQEKRPDDRFME
jgi:hypothetical protein